MASLPNEPNQAATVESVLKAIDVLFYMTCGQPDVGVTEVSEALGLPKAVVYRMLTSLRVRGLVEIDAITHRYVLAPRVLLLGEAYRSRVDVRQICRVEMATLVAKTNETTTLSVRHGNSRSYIDQITPNRDVHMTITIGKSFPLHLGASSKAFLAFLPQEEIDVCIADALLQKNQESITSVDDLNEQLAAIRTRGYAISIGERDPSAGAIAVPVFRIGEVGPVAVMSVCGPRDRFANDQEFIACSLLDAAHRASLKLGYQTSYQPGPPLPY